MTLSLNVSRETETRLRTYDALLHKWQKAVNLVSPGTLPDSWNRHIIDSLQLLPLIPDHVKTLYDLGSGAGFPGVVLAVARPDIKVTLVESDQKKCTFMMTVSHETKTDIHIQNIRIDKASESLPPPDMVSARALANLSELLLMIRPWVEKNKNIIALFPKGAQYASEIEAAQKVARFDVQAHISQTDPAARILEIRNIVFI